MAPPPYTYADKCAALTLMDAGLSLKDITAQLGLSKRTLIRLAAGSVRGDHGRRVPGRCD